MRDYSVKATLILVQTAVGLLLLWYGLHALNGSLNEVSLKGGLQLILGLVTLGSNLAIPGLLASSSLAARPRSSDTCCQLG